MTLTFRIDFRLGNLPGGTQRQRTEDDVRASTSSFYKWGGGGMKVKWIEKRFLIWESVAFQLLHSHPDWGLEIQCKYRPKQGRDLGGVNIKSIFGFQYLRILNEMTQEKEWYAAYRAEQKHHEHVPIQIPFKKKKTVRPYDRQPKKQSQQ